MNNDFDDIFDDAIRKNIKNSFDDITLSDDLINKIKIEANKKRTFKEKISEFLNYEVEIPIGQMGVVAAILALIPLGFTAKEYENIMDNKIEPINIVGSLEGNN